MRTALVGVVLAVTSFWPYGLVWAGEPPPGGTFYDDDGNTHEGYIEAVAAASITAGCNEAGTFYCPSRAVTRGQMATFIGRALSLPPGGHLDAFDDDEGSVHEAWINVMAAIGVTSGCDPFAPRRYCPDEPVSRAQMATFLVRAFPNLTASSADVFDDDDGSVHERNIDGVAVAGVTQGCSVSDTSRYCPRQSVRRDQMATFLGRALALTPMVPPPRVGFVCTEVIGFSQTSEWYEPNGGAFESGVDDASWQLRWDSGAGVDLIAGSDWEGWALDPFSGCEVPIVDRAVLTISGISGSDVAAWTANIRAAVTQIWLQHPTTREILLQPVVGGPNESVCNWNGQQVRASVQHPYIDQAIAQVAAIEPGVNAGFSPELPDCSGYRDNIGHLEPGYHSVVGTEVGQYYAGL